MKIDARGAMRKLALAKAAVIDAGNTSVEALTELGKWKAFQLAPKYSRRTALMIKKQIYKTANGTEGKIIAQNPTVGDQHRLFPGGRYAGKFNLVRWMHATKGIFQSDNPFGKAGTKHITSGDSTFMYSTRSYLNRIKKSVARGSYKKNIIGG